MCCPKCIEYINCSEVKEYGESNSDCCPDCECFQCKNHPKHVGEDNIQQMMQQTKQEQRTLRVNPLFRRK